MTSPIPAGELDGSWTKNTKILSENSNTSLTTLWKTFYEVGKGDPRRVRYSLKVGLALTVVSFLYILEPLHDRLGQNAGWAVITVAVVLEFTAGATLCKGVNRGIGTLLAASLSFLIEYVSQETEPVFRAVFIGVSVFFVGAFTAYIRFIPYVKNNYEHGVVVFLLTFNLITVSSHRANDVVRIACDRSYTIAIGCGVCLIASLLIVPVWSSADLHTSTVVKLEALAKSIKGCVNEYFDDADEEQIKENSAQKYKIVLDSITQDETLALHASWEPRHLLGGRYPWQQYVKVGMFLRHLGYTVASLHGCLRAEIQTPESCRKVFKDPCTRVAEEVSNVLMELASSVKGNRHSNPDILSDHLHQALEGLKAALSSQPRLFLSSKNLAFVKVAKESQKREKILESVKSDSFAVLELRKKLRRQGSKMAISSLAFCEALPFAAFVSLLLESVAKLDSIIEEVKVLGQMAGFKDFTSQSDQLGAYAVQVEENETR